MTRIIKLLLSIIKPRDIEVRVSTTLNVSHGIMAMLNIFLTDILNGRMDM